MNASPASVPRHRVRILPRRLTYSLTGSLSALAAVIAMTACSASLTTGHDTTRTSTAPLNTVHPTPSSATPTGTSEYTIADYIRDADIAEVPVRRGDSTAPGIELPDMPGWVEATAQAPAGTYRAVKYTPGITAADYSPNVVVLMSRLTGRTIDPDRIFAAAPGEVRNLTGFTPIGRPALDTLAGYKAYKIAGTYDLDGLEAVVGQTTLLLPGTNTAYVVQINVTGARSQLETVRSAIGSIEKGLRITL